MSKREEIQKQLEDWLLEHRNKFDAPYGVISGLEPFGKGKVRVITFGIARYLDATIHIYQPNSISIDGRGALAYKYAGHFKSVEEVIEHLNK